MKGKKRVLVVDDEPRILRFIAAKLGVAGYEVITTTSGEEALSLAESEQPSIMLLDIMMTPLSGFDVLDRLRTFSQIPVIVFTGRSIISNQAIKMGASDYLAKPFDPDELVQKIKKALDGSGPG